MTQLYRGMYGTQFEPSSSLFGLQCGQMHPIRIIKNAGWYNKRGEKLGFGDIAEVDVKRITRDINADELFVLLPEEDSFWDFVVEEGPTLIGAHAVTNPAEQQPGELYLAHHCRFILGRESIYYIDTNPIHPTKAQGWPTASKVVSRDEAFQLLIAT